MKQLPDKRNGVWVTPRSFFDPVQREFSLEVDSAASKQNAMLPRFWDKRRDAFKQDWSGLRIWCNPPYGRGIYRWVEKCATAPASIVVALLPARTDTKWFHEFIYGKINAETRFIKGRIKFSGSKCGGKFPSMLVIFKSTSSPPTNA